VVSTGMVLHLLTLHTFYCTIFTFITLLPNTSLPPGQDLFSFLFSDFVGEKKRKDTVKNCWKKKEKR
jgi:hypothetical protein